MKSVNFAVYFIIIHALILIVVSLVFSNKETSFFPNKQEQQQKNGVRTESYFVTEVTTTIESVNCCNVSINQNLWEVVEFTTHDYGPVYYRDSLAGDISQTALKFILFQLKESHEEVKILYRIKQKEKEKVSASTGGELRTVLSIRTKGGNILWQDHDNKVIMSIKIAEGLMSEGEE